MPHEEISSELEHGESSHESWAHFGDLADINSNQPSSMDTDGARSPQPRTPPFAGSCMVHRHRSLPITFSVVVRRATSPFTCPRGGELAA